MIHYKKDGDMGRDVGMKAFLPSESPLNTPEAKQALLIEVAEAMQDRYEVLSRLKWDLNVKKPMKDCGVTYHNRDGSCSIVLDRRLQPVLMLQTLLHEFAHVVAGYRAYHGPRWRKRCYCLIQAFRTLPMGPRMKELAHALGEDPRMMLSINKNSAKYF